ncbi:hypothetical protein QX204_13015 [Nocardia sp. PE-7]|uniref:DUF7373 family lipoprotein n=1 Tax=Nocardia sp. PE-7 TaxID=3058426 RepID=UPI0026593985|nr:hypothetical protein [Nocardia sp. PE-7]WKG12326.1 hypothetical protein QX204_13015 [Nocardia sp. PE-7]
MVEHRTPVTARLALGALAVLLVGCGTVDGTATPGEIDVRSLEVGSLTTVPADIEIGRKPTDGPILEGLRMAGAVVFPHEVDPALTHNWGTDVLDTPRRASDASAISNVNLGVLERHRMIVGFDIAEGSQAFDKAKPAIETDARVTRVVLLRFPGAKIAEEAARDLEATDFGVSPDNQPVQIPGYPAAHAHWRPGVKTIGATFAHGEIVVSLFLQHPSPDIDALAKRVAAVLDAQIPLLDKFTPTAPDRIADLPRDPDDLLRRTLIPGPANQQIAIASREFAAWTGRAGLHYRPTEPAELGAAWDRGGVDSVAHSYSTTLFRFRDDAAASAFGATWQDTLSAAAHPVAAPEGLPQARCAERRAAGGAPALTRCYVSYRRYGAFVSGAEPAGARRQAAAQYALLANAQ